MPRFRSEALTDTGRKIELDRSRSVTLGHRHRGLTLKSKQLFKQNEPRSHQIIALHAHEPKLTTQGDVRLASLASKIRHQNTTWLLDNATWLLRYMVYGRPPLLSG